ncbi:hypothetical protein R3W88_024721 [Solanum pinnatisectum]|uniref:Uncharacterized protein n=1 Tax=Solanum pinnatisectum TaxID=50273 RepID=A0AAV9M215_9SOLN|nr:hypothetical protein R3W88_024721 [Solanum pinnatisectum]
MDIENMFLNSFSIEKKPDICDLIEAAILVGASKYPVEFEKHKNRIFNLIKYPGEHDIDDEDDDIKRRRRGLGTLQITTESNKPLETKIRIVFNKSVQVVPLKKHNNCNANLVQKLDKQGTPQSDNTTTMASRKRMNDSTKRVQVAPPRVRLLFDLSFEKHLDRGKQLQKQSQRLQEDGERKECTAGLTKSMLPPFMKMNVEVSPPHPKQSNCSSSTRLMQKTSQSSAVARSMQKETQSDSDMKKKFESSKRKLEQRLADQRKAKIRIIMIDFHQTPKLANDPRALLEQEKGFEIMIIRVVGNFSHKFLFLLFCLVILESISLHFIFCMYE